MSSSLENRRIPAAHPTAAIDGTTGARARFDRARLSIADAAAVASAVRI